MLAVVESPIFQRLWPRYWDEEECAEFASLIAITRTLALSYVGLAVFAKSGGQGAKSKSESISLDTLKEIRRALEI